MKNVLVIGLDKNLFSGESTDSFQRQVSYSKNFKSLTILVYTNKKYSIIRKDNLTIIPTNSKNIFFAFFDFLLMTRKIKFKIDVVSTQDPFFLGLVGLIISKKFNSKFRPQLHIEAFSNPFWRKESKLNYLQFLIGKFVVSKADIIRVVSKRSQEYFNNLNIKNTFIPVPTNFKKFSKKNISREFDLIYVGRFVQQKNLFFLLDLIFELKKELPEISILLVGNGVLKKKLLLKVKKLNLEKNIFFSDFVKHDDINSYYNKSRILILPSLYEGWGLVAIEASLSGLSIVMSNTGCAGEIIIDGVSGVVSPINDLEYFKKGILKIFGDSKTAIRYNQSAILNITRKLNFDKLNNDLVNYLNGK